MSEPRFRDLVEVTRAADDTYIGRCAEGGRGRIFGGQVAAQALHAAGCRLRCERAPHSLHLYFLRPGDPNRPVTYFVSTLRDGRTFSTFQVHACQGERIILTAVASFARTENSVEYQVVMPATEDPETCPVDDFAPPNTNGAVRKPLEFRTAMRHAEPAPGTPSQHLWFRSRLPLSDDDLEHACAVTYATDLSLPLTAHLPLHSLDDYHAGASLDHTLWFHRPIRADEWLLLELSSTSYAAARGLSHGKLFDRGGHLVASAAQESLIRMP